MISRKEFHRLMRQAHSCSTRSINNPRNQQFAETLWKRLHTLLPKVTGNGDISGVLSDWACVWEVAKYLTVNTPFSLKDWPPPSGGGLVVRKTLSACHRLVIWKCGAPDYVLDLDHLIPDEVYAAYSSRELDDLPERSTRIDRLLKAMEEGQVKP